MGQPHGETPQLRSVPVVQLLKCGFPLADTHLTSFPVERHTPMKTLPAWRRFIDRAEAAFAVGGPGSRSSVGDQGAVVVNWSIRTVIGALLAVEDR
jgi:hypothetical protein